MYRRQEERLNDNCILENEAYGGGSLMVWGGEFRLEDALNWFISMETSIHNVMLMKFCDPKSFRTLGRWVMEQFFKMTMQDHIGAALH